MFMKTSDINFDFSSRVVIVVGGSKGIGKQVCIQFLNSKAKVYSISRTDPCIAGVKFIKCDISKQEDIERAMKSFEKIDFLINVAGTNLCVPIEEIKPEEWDRVINTNLKSFYLLSQSALEIMKKNNFGRIVNVSSIAGRTKSLVSGVHYTASKYGVIGLTKQLAHECSKYNVLVNCTCPSQTKTEMLQNSMNEQQLKKLEENIPLGRISTTKEQAMPILFLCSSAASYISGTVVDVNGGQF